MSLFRKTDKPVITEQQPVVVPEGQLLILGARVYRAELFGLVEVPVKTIEAQNREREAERVE